MAQTSNQVKFYAVNTLPASPEQYNLYFVNGGELYKGTQRFGLAKVFEKPTTGDNIPETPPTTDVARGDIAVGWGAAKVYNGSAWVDLGADSTITDDLTSRVEAIESHVIVSQNLISATTGSFTNLTADSATFTATTLNATSMTVGGKTIDQIANERIAAIPARTVTASNNGIEVGVTTQSGMVTAVTVNAAAFANVVNFDGVITSGALPTTPKSGDIVVIGTPDTEADPPEALAQGLLPGQEYIYTGDTVDDGHPYDSDKWQLIGDQTATQSQIDTAISSALAYSSETGVTTSASTLNAAVEALASAIDGAKTEISSPDSASGDLVTASAVIGYVSGTRWNASDTAYPIGEGENRPFIAVEIDESAEKKVVVNATNFGTAVGANVVTLAQGETFASKSNSSDLPTASQVYSFVTSQIGSITASSIIVGTPGEQLEWDGPLASLDTSTSTVLNALAILNAAISDVSTTLDEVSAATVPFVAEQGYSGTILSSIDAASDATLYSAIEALDVAITTLSQSLGDAAYKGVATSIGPSTSIPEVPAQGTEGEGDYVPATPSVPAADHTKLATEKAVRDALDEVVAQTTLCWYEES